MRQAFEEAKIGNPRSLRKAQPSSADWQAARLARLAALSLDRNMLERAIALHSRLRFANDGANAEFWSAATGGSFALGDYAAAARAALALLQCKSLAPDERAGVMQTLAIAQALSSAPSQEVSALSAVHSISGKLDRVGLLRMPIAIASTSVDAVLDTGANLSVISSSLAAKIGLIPLGGSKTVQSSTSATVESGLAIAPIVMIGDVEIRNVVFLVLPDQALAFDARGPYSIDAIVGFPILKSLRHLRVHREGRIEFGALKSGGDGVSLWAIGSSLYSDVEIDDFRIAMHLDTGAAQSGLSSRFAAEHPRTVAPLAATSRSVGGAGQSIVQKMVRWPQRRVFVGGKLAGMLDVEIALDGPDVALRPYGVLGNDLLRQFAFYELDFGQMKLRVGPQVRSDVPAPAP